MGALLQDMRFAARMLARRPAFTLLAVATLAVGIGASSSIFSMVNGIVLQQLPYPSAEQIVRVHTTNPEGGFDNWSGANYIDLVDRSTSFAAIAAYEQFQYHVQGPEGPQRIMGASVTTGYFSVFGVNALHGRTLSAALDSPGRERSVVLSFALWQSQFGGDPGVLGTVIQLNEESYTVVGIMPPGFSYPSNTRLWTASRYLVPEPPFDFGDDPAEVRGAEYMNAIGRLREDVPFDRAAAEITALGELLAQEYPDSNAGESFLLQPLHESEVGQVRPMLLMLFAAVGFVMLIACANVANLLLARATGRTREIAIRTALGAGRPRIVRQLITESLLLGLAGGLAGLLLALWGTDVLLTLVPEGVPRTAEVGTDLIVVGFTLLVSIAAGVMFGLAPALMTFRRDLHATMREGARGYTAGAARSRARSVLIVAEVAISLVLLVGAGLMIRTLASLAAVDPGFTSRTAITANVWVPATKYAEGDQMRAFYREILDGIRAIPQVEAAGAVFSLPVDHGIFGTLAFTIAGQPNEEGEQPVEGFQMATTGYFETMGIPLLRGRYFDELDRSGAAPVAVVSKAFADKYWPGEDPLGNRLAWSDPEDEETNWHTVVGVVGNARYDGLGEEPRAETYVPYEQFPMPFMTFVVSSRTDVTSTAAAVRAVVLAVDPTQPIFSVRTLDTMLSDSLARNRFNMLLMSIFAGAAVLMAVIGLYGVLSYSVAQRSNEIGIRMALGAGTGEITRQVLGEGGRLIGIGLLLGTIGAAALTGLLRTLIHGVSPTDPISFVAGIIVLAMTALVASLVPALRAARVDPMVALRNE